MNIGIIGYGSMGKMMLLKYLAAAEIDQSQFYVANRTYDKIKNLRLAYPQLNVCRDAAELAPAADIVFICVKPLDIKPVLSSIAGKLKPSCHVVSLNSSVLFSHLERIAPNRKISKAVPSITAEVNQSITLVCHNPQATQADKEVLYRLLSCFGSITEIPETELALGAVVTSSMPGFIGAFFKIITDETAKHTALPRETLYKMLLETYYGTGTFLMAKGITFDNLIERVATKGGLTEEGTEVINAQFPAIMDAIFVKTLAKRKTIIEQAIEEFDT
ncbi:MAG: NAD(P)-binding domain-containing protein [Spirochaetaceae bacterium]|jgi:pyrroline-5-carboxylate reductase|nr:NAD(P)-binding domain-containing protein [Spirochaetaceae bacterium]